MTRTPTDEAVGDGLDTRAIAGIVRARLFDDADPYRIGRFTVLERIGAGGMGVVYAAFDAELDRRVAIKVLVRRDAAEQGRIIREAKAMAKLAHPNVAHVYEVGTHGDDTYIAMEHVRGQTLRKWIEETPRSWRDVLAMYVQAGRGLAAAHAAGIVHRDFKPDNVIVGEDGRPRVLDFGLARMSGDRPASTLAESLESPAGTLTESGTVVGTPAYMAPEHARGDVVEARGDQFAFCVALWEALAGKRPFSGRTVSEVIAAAAEGRIVPAPRRAMPGWIGVELRRGLVADPEQRHASMDALLERLSRDPSVWRRRVVAVGVVGLAIAGGFGWRELDRVAHERACADAGDAIAADWNDDRRRALGEAFAATGLSYATDTWARASARIDAFVDTWSTQRTDTCLATIDDGERACFDERRAHLVALLDSLAEPDAGVVQQAVISAAALPSPLACGDPRTPALDDAVPAEVRAEIARITALRTTGRLDDAWSAASELFARIERDGPDAALPEVELALGTVENARGRYPEARQALERSFYAAGAAGADMTMLQAARTLVDNVGYRQAEVAEGLRWHALAQMLVTRLQLEDHPEVAALENQLGLVQDVAGAYDEAIAAHERALAIREHTLGADHPDVAGSLFNIATVHAKRGAIEEALAAYRRSLAIDESALGPDHPHVAGTLNSIGQTLTQRGDYDEALTALQRALAIKERVYGPQHPSIGTTLVGIGNIHNQHGRNEDALVLYRRAREIFEAKLGPAHPHVASTLSSEGGALAELGRPQEALPLLRRALSIQEEMLGSDHADLAPTLIGLASVLFHAGQHDEALAMMERARAVMLAALGPNHPDLAVLLTNIGMFQYDRGRVEDAERELERAAEIYEKAAVTPYERTDTEFLLARVLWDLDRDRERALTLARAAREARARFGDARAMDVAEIDTWLSVREGP